MMTEREWFMFRLLYSLSLGTCIGMAIGPLIAWAIHYRHVDWWESPLGFAGIAINVITMLMLRRAVNSRGLRPSR